MRNVVIILSILLVSVWAHGPVHAANEIGKAVKISQNVTGNSGGKTRNVASSAAVYANERLTSNSTGLGQFVLNDGTKLVLGSNSSLVLDNLVYTSGGNGIKKLTLKASNGVYRFITGSGNSKAYSIKTPVGTLGIRGTAFDINVSGGKTYVLLYSGKVNFCNRAGTCRLMERRCEIVAATSNKISEPRTTKDSGLSKQQIAKIFPIAVDQRKLGRAFRQRTRACSAASTAAKPALAPPATTTQAALTTPEPPAVSEPEPEPEPPAAGVPNNPGNDKAVGNASESPNGQGFGNGSIGRGDRGDASASASGSGGSGSSGNSGSSGGGNSGNSGSSGGSSGGGNGNGHGAGGGNSGNGVGNGGPSGGGDGGNGGGGNK